MGEANLSRYALIEEIGQGGMGTVYRATDTKLLREVAIKVRAGVDLHRAVKQEGGHVFEMERQAAIVIVHSRPG